MVQPLIGELEESYRTALVAYYMGQVAPKNPPFGWVVLKSEDDLSELLCMDVKDNSKVETSSLAHAIASVQKYINSVYYGMEPGYYGGDFKPEEVEYWNMSLNNYGDWAGYKMVQDYPENYIDPLLRLKKTSLFKELETNLGQMRITEDSVQQALLEYLRVFQERCDLEVMSGYVNSSDFQNATYYFIGRQRTPPFSYYWRSARLQMRNDTTVLDPTGWGEWHPLNIPAGNKVLECRPVFWQGRLHVVWVETKEKVVDGNKVLEPWSIELKVAYLTLNGHWSVPITLNKTEGKDDDPEIPKDGKLVAVVFVSDLYPKGKLVAYFTNRKELEGVPQQGEVEINESRDMLFRELATEPAMLELVLDRFKLKETLQYEIGSGDYTSIEINRVEGGEGEVPGELNNHLWLEAFCYRRKVGNDVFDTLRVRGVCDGLRGMSARQEMQFFTSVERESGRIDVCIQGLGEDLISVVCFSSDLVGMDFSLRLNNELLAEFWAIEFYGSSGSSLTANKTIKLSELQLTTLLNSTKEQIKAGGGFSIPELDTMFDNDENILGERGGYDRVEFGLAYPVREVADSPDFKENFMINGEVRTSWLEYRRKVPAHSSVLSLPIDEPIPFVFGVIGERAQRYGRNRLTVTVKTPLKLFNVPKIHTNTTTGAQFLDFNNDAQFIQYVRLNSLFGPELVARANISTQAVLSWDTQHIQEPPVEREANNPGVPEAPLEPNGPFDGANGRYFWELFFHLPHLVACRLSAEGRFIEAQNWFHFIFDPQTRHRPEPVPGKRLDYWWCRPISIQEQNENPGYAVIAPTDPDAIAYSKPVHYRIAVFMAYVHNLMAFGDSLYRRLTRDSLVTAKLHYIRALSLMGDMPVASTVNRWQPKNVEELLEDAESLDELRAFESSLRVNLANLPHSVEHIPRLGLLGSKIFRKPINRELLAVWENLDQRLSNLRNYLTIDGKPLWLPLFSPPSDPRALLRAQAGGSSGLPRHMGGQLVVVPYRWRVMLEVASRAADTLSRFGEQVRLHLEQRDRGELEELQQTHVIELGSYAKAVQEETIAQLRAIKSSLQESKAVATQRAAHYAELFSRGISEAEYSVMNDLFDAKAYGIAANPFFMASALADLAPNLFGTSTGGSRWGGVPQAIGQGLQLGADIIVRNAEKSATNEQYRRRQEEWGLARDQANQEVFALDEQIVAQEHAIDAALANLQMTEAANTQAQALYAFYKNRATNVELSRWQLGQMKTLYFQAYDAVVALCLAAQACWWYEMGDYDTTYIRPDVWLDDKHGLTAGESLKLDLLRMESAFFQRHERRLQLVKTISLRQLFNGGTQETPNWDAFLDKLRTDGSDSFKLSQQLFDNERPGHYCRQIISVGVSVPVTQGPYQDIHVSLRQDGSSIATKPTMESVEYLRNPVGAPPLDIKFNLRSSQEICVSRGLDDDGLIAMDFDNSRYLPFEGTGAVSKWSLTLPRHAQPHQEALLDSLTDIIVHLRYMAKDGGSVFTAAVEGPPI